MNAPMAPAEMTAREIVGRLWRDYLHRRRSAFGLAMLLAAIGAGLNAWGAALLGRAVDAIGAGTAGLVLPFAALLVLMALLRGLAQVGQGMLVNRLGNGLVSDVQKQLFSRMMRADLARLRAAHSGGFVSSVLFDAALIREAATTGLINYTQQSLTIIVMLGYMVWLDWTLALGVFLVAPLVLIMVRRFNQRSKKAIRGTMEETSALSTALMEGLDGVRVVKIDNREAFEEARIAEVIDRRQRHLVKGGDAKSQLAPATDVIGTAMIAAVLAYAGWRAASAGLSVGGLLSFLWALGMAGNALRQIANIQSNFAEGLTATRRLFAALDVEPEVRESAGAAALATAPTRLAFERVGFAYGGAPVLDNLELEVRRGETIALVGPSGGGKSTALNLIPRFYDVSSGKVTLDGRDVREIPLHDLRSHIALVTQEPFLFDDTIAANIGYSRTEASREQIEAAAKAAAAHDFIAAMPDGYLTRVGEAGARLSGGQRQRIAIARAFLKDAPILLLDEATSALDAESESQVQLALERLMKGRATIVIAHRLSTVRHADRIYVLDGGRVVEAGTHAGLVAKKGLYARLAKGQDLEPAS